MASKEEARQILRTGYGRVLFNTAADYVAPILWGESRNKTTPPIVNNACIFFLNCGGPTFAITAEHVYAGYLRSKKSNPNLACQVGNLNFDPSSRIIDSDSELDIATFLISDHEVASIGKTVHYVSSLQWPPAPPILRKGVFFCGFPASGRSFRERRSLDLETFFAGLTAENITDREIHCVFRREDWLDIEGNDYPGVNVELGGISGSPLWTLIQSRNIFAWRLAGIVIEFNREFEILISRRPDCIRADGKLVRLD